MAIAAAVERKAGARRPRKSTTVGEAKAALETDETM
jgi:hypothetical protein